MIKPRLFKNNTSTRGVDILLYSIYAIAFVILIYSLIFSFNETPKKAISILETLGYSDIQLTGYKFFSCGKGDLYNTGFVARKNDNLISGTVCSGVLKGYTVRFD